MSTTLTTCSQGLGTSRHSSRSGHKRLGWRARPFTAQLLLWPDFTHSTYPRVPRLTASAGPCHAEHNLLLKPAWGRLRPDLLQRPRRPASSSTLLPGAPGEPPAPLYWAEHLVPKDTWALSTVADALRMGNGQPGKRTTLRKMLSDLKLYSREVMFLNRRMEVLHSRGGATMTST